MTTTLPPDPLLDSLKQAPALQDFTVEDREALGGPLRNAIGMSEAQPWAGGPLHVNTGVRWYGQNPLLWLLGITRTVRIQIQAPVYRLDVDEQGISLRGRRRWVRYAMLAITWLMSRDLIPEVTASWSDISAIRRTRQSLTTWSVIEFCINGEWIGVATFRTRSLDAPWSAVVHHYRASRPRATGDALEDSTEGVA
jgi:hypothetical protein